LQCFFWKVFIRIAVARKLSDLALLEQFQGVMSLFELSSCIALSQNVPV
jgi:hypothetical protein